MTAPLEGQQKPKYNPVLKSGKWGKGGQPWQHSWCVNDKTKFSRFPGTMIWNLERPGFTACGVNLRAPGHHPPPAVAHFPPGCCSPVSAWLPRPHWRVVSAGDPVRPCTRHLMCELLAGRWIPAATTSTLCPQRCPGIKFEARCQYSGYLATPLLPSQLLIFHSSHNSTTSVSKTRKSSFFNSIYVFATTISEESAKSQIIINESENNFHLLYWSFNYPKCKSKFMHLQISTNKNFLNGGTVATPIIPHICQIISTTEISDWANFSYALHKKFTSWCPTTPFWVEALFYLCCVGTGTGYLPQSTPTIQTHQKHELATQ